LEKPILHIENLNVFKKDKYILKEISMSFPEKSVTAIIGEPGAGKSVLLKALNRLLEEEGIFKIYGNVYLNGANTKDFYIGDLRKQIGLVMPESQVFPVFSIYQNVLAAYILSGIKLDKNEADEIVESNLHTVRLWDDLKSSLHEKAANLKPDQAFRLCLARTLAIDPKIVMLDEPMRSFNPNSYDLLEEIIYDIAQKATIIAAAHNPLYSSSISEYTAFIHKGELIERGLTKKLFTNPTNHLTEMFITGKL
jgi:phosphate transport system ATP-binding protein